MSTVRRTLQQVALPVSGSVAMSMSGGERTKEEKENGKLVEWKALDRRVIAVAKEGYAGDWAAYIGAVPGENHEQEWQEVMKHGNKLQKEVAEVLFPNFASKFVWRGA